MNEDAKVNENKITPVPKTTLPYLIAVVGAVIGVAGHFIKYLTASNLFFSRKVSVFQMIAETIDDPQNMIGSVLDKIVFGIVIAGITFTLFAVLFALLKKMKAAIVFSVLAFLPFLLIGNAWIHYAGFALTIVGAIWYLIARKRNQRLLL